MWVKKWSVRKKKREENNRKNTRPVFRLHGKYAPRDIVWRLGCWEGQEEKEKEEKEDEEEKDTTKIGTSPS